MKIHSFGCSFVAGNGVDSKIEKTLIGTPDLRKFREENSFTGQLSKLLLCEYNNYGKSGSNPNYSIDKLCIELKNKTISKGDLVIFTLTSPLRNTPEFFPSFFEPRNKLGQFGLTFGLNELEYFTQKDYPELSPEIPSVENRVLDYRKQFIAKYFDYNNHFDYYSQNCILLLQYLFDLNKINHIFIDAFDLFVSSKIYDKTKHIDKTKYWNYQKHNIWSYLDTFNDKSLFEDEELSETLYNGRLHPSAKGHKIIAEELYKLYNKLYG